mmetsp:Transcript_39618/g.82323  ORF Transcript_39618/g.82323 Transcript_39618/m.82323 type:complete len:284 (-) Transcript_39618:749-1600(-)
MPIVVDPRDGLLVFPPPGWWTFSARKTRSRIRLIDCATLPVWHWVCDARRVTFRVLPLGVAVRPRSIDFVTLLEIWDWSSMSLVWIVEKTFRVLPFGSETRPLSIDFAILSVIWEGCSSTSLAWIVVKTLPRNAGDETCCPTPFPSIACATLPVIWSTNLVWMVGTRWPVLRHLWVTPRGWLRRSAFEKLQDVSTNLVSVLSEKRALVISGMFLVICEEIGWVTRERPSRKTDAGVEWEVRTPFSGVTWVVAESRVLARVPGPWEWDPFAVAVFAGITTRLVG